MKWFIIFGAVSGCLIAYIAFMSGYWAGSHADEHDRFQRNYYKVRLIEEADNVRDAERQVRDLERKNVELQARLANFSNGPGPDELAIGK